ncbi:MAG: DeoR/GlpR family DNA-binding transcription regulator [Intrasporangium sp.]|uniref:DeoR/GlpR family DNA-binding transcription regulator n=1 Tax=Intrasporangium sp. TaxID=1925024 RepID=UPI0026470BF3|nr:DeoR/GlpR family DNA-binding transcription regulator [Intrasporangium sp.]MDN5797124.1 DeoR/GlpR family DNA-binding transcription regulator [Intrasporangium sp.]
MLASQRRSLITEFVEREGAVRISELVDRLGVSDMTIRRDIDRLSCDGVVERVHGGAVHPDGAHRSEEPGFAAKSLLQQAQKRAIARAAVDLVEPGSAIGISAGTTTVELARRLTTVPGLTVVTNSLPAAQLLHETGGAGHTLVLTGGVRTPSDALVGPIAVAALESLHVDLLFIGSHGVDVTAGLTTPNLVEADTNRALIRAGHRVCVLADSTKWGVVSLSTFGGLADVDVLVTDSGLSPTARRAAREQVGQLIVVKPERGTA